MPLTSKQRRHLRALAHHLDPVATVGVNGLSGPVITKVIEELEHHELIKVKISPDAPQDKAESAGALADRSGSELVQVIGHIAVLYKPRAKKPSIRLPKAESA